MEIKIVKTTDTELLAKLNRDVQEIHYHIEPEMFKPHSIENMKQLFDNALTDVQNSAYIAMCDDEPAGYMLISKKEYEENFFKLSYSVVHIDQICVDSAYKGKGIGKILVDFAKNYASEQGIKRLEMNFWTKNTNSGEFFRSQGFENFNERMVLKL